MSKRAFNTAEERKRFLDEIEDELRYGRAEQAMARVQEALATLEGADAAMVQLAQTTRSEQLWIIGWSNLAERIAKYEAQFDTKITALGFDISDPVHFGYEPDEDGRLVCDIETNYFADLPDLAFSKAGRDELAKAKTSYGDARWKGEFVEVETLIEIKGMEALYGAVHMNVCGPNQESVEADAYALCACCCAILFYQTVRQTVRAQGLPRPLTILVGSNEEFPHFDTAAWIFDES